MLPKSRKDVTRASLVTGNKDSMESADLIPPHALVNACACVRGE